MEYLRGFMRRRLGDKQTKPIVDSPQGTPTPPEAIPGKDTSDISGSEITLPTEIGPKAIAQSIRKRALQPTPTPDQPTPTESLEPRMKRSSIPLSIYVDQRPTVSKPEPIPEPINPAVEAERIRVLRAKTVIDYLGKIPDDDRKKASTWTREQLQESINRIPKSNDTESYQFIPEDIRMILIRIAEISQGKYTDPKRIVEDISNIKFIGNANVTLKLLSDRPNIKSVGELIERLEANFRSISEPPEEDTPKK